MAVSIAASISASLSARKNLPACRLVTQPATISNAAQNAKRTNSPKMVDVVALRRHLPAQRAFGFLKCSDRLNSVAPLLCDATRRSATSPTALGQSDGIFLRI